MKIIVKQDTLFMKVNLSHETIRANARNSFILSEAGVSPIIPSGGFFPYDFPIRFIGLVGFPQNFPISF